MTCLVKGNSFICSRGGGRQPCAGAGKPVVVKPSGTAYGQDRRECPVCGRVDLPTYQTEDGRTVLLPH